ncbi:MAG: hypothetical protein NC253_11690 [Ruminococcus sp.]|nr:hypothetical protein [Ruminococcus sp.]MCM1381135.1 hypothetical protein [Muribaculaceae bacterium]MCM1479807.1 hypothetical protein [Muribaculaceae bacterium]
MGDTDKQFTAKLLEEYFYNMRIRKIAEKEGAEETLKVINERLELIRLQVQPTELPKE